MAQLPPVPAPPENPITQPKAILGKVLFWDEQLSSTNTVACGTCHSSHVGGGEFRFGVNPGADEIFNTPDDIFGSPGVARFDVNEQPVDDFLFGFDVQVTDRTAPSSFGALWADDIFWDGRARSQFLDPETGLVSIPSGGGLESQAVGPILSDVEMAHEGRTWDDVISKLESVVPLALATYLPPDMEAAVAGNTTYGDLFNAAFGDSDITAERIGFAIATYERTLVPDQTPFDQGTLNAAQQRGLNVFQNPGSACSQCHTLPTFSDNTFRNIGVRPPNEDIGRQAVTGNPADRGRFKVPTLRNVGLKLNYMHNGEKETLEEVIDFYIGRNGQMQFPQNIDPLIPPINMPPPARADLIQFLRNGLTDDRVAEETFPFDRPVLRGEIGDANRDDLVDYDDHQIFVNCMSGPDVNTDPDAVNKPCQRIDADGDFNVDVVDFIEFSLRFGT